MKKTNKLKIKKIVATFLISIVSLSTLVGCNNSQDNWEQAEIKENVETGNDSVSGNNAIDTQANGVSVEEKEHELDPLYDDATMQKSRYGLDGIFVYDLVEIFEDGLDFFIYIENSENENENLSNAIKWGIEENNIENNDIAFYLIDFSTLNSAEQEKLLEYFIPGTTYCVSNREIVSSFTKIPEDNVENYQEEYNNLFANWFYSTQVGIKDYGLEFISIEDVKLKIENKEKFALYIGRPSCKYCRIFTPQLEEIISDETNQLNIPIYYFYTQEYKNNINDEIEGSQETWDEVKDYLGIQYTPSFVVYNNDENGEKLKYENFIGDDYIDANEEEKATLLEEGKNDLLAFLIDNELLTKVESSSIQIGEETLIDYNCLDQEKLEDPEFAKNCLENIEDENLEEINEDDDTSRVTEDGNGDCEDGEATNCE